MIRRNKVRERRRKIGRKRTKRKLRRKVMRRRWRIKTKWEERKAEERRSTSKVMISLTLKNGILTFFFLICIFASNDYHRGLSYSKSLQVSLFSQTSVRSQFEFLIFSILFLLF